MGNLVIWISISVKFGGVLQVFSPDELLYKTWHFNRQINNPSCKSEMKYNFYSKTTTYTLLKNSALLTSSRPCTARGIQHRAALYIILTD